MSASKSHKKGVFYCGTSNVELPVRSKAFFPEEFQDKSRLHYYATLFNSVEVNSTFYKLPLPKTILRWSDDVGDSFQFTFKVWREISHAKGLDYKVEDVERFMQVLSICPKKGALLLQFPASVKRSLFMKVKQLISDMRDTGLLNSWKLAVEFRDSSWYTETVYEMLEEYNATIVTHDMPKSRTPIIDMEQSCIYVRFHGEEGNYRGGYQSDFLEEYSMLIQDWLSQGLDVYAYFNNTIGDAVNNAIFLSRILKNG